MLVCDCISIYISLYILNLNQNIYFIHFVSQKCFNTKTIQTSHNKNMSFTILVLFLHFLFFFVYFHFSSPQCYIFANMLTIHKFWVECVFRFMYLYYYIIVFWIRVTIQHIFLVVLRWSIDSFLSREEIYSGCLLLFLCVCHILLYCF